MPMKNKIPSNNKGQFFIAMAVVIIVSLSAIFFYASTTSFQHSTDAELKEQDMYFFANNIKDEFVKVAELTLANVSHYGMPLDVIDCGAAFDHNLSNFSGFSQAVAYQNGIFLNVSFARVEATNTSMNASINLTFSRGNSIMNLNFSAVKNITVKALNGSLTNQLPSNPIHPGEGCSFNFSARKEYNEPLPNMTSLNFAVLINATACSSSSYTEYGNGKYNFTCTNSGCAGSKITLNVTDTRNIVSFSVIPNTGSRDDPPTQPPDYGCAGLCGQPID